MINFADPYFEFKEHRSEILEAITNVLDNGQYILGPEVDKFEKSFSSFCNVYQCLIFFLFLVSYSYTEGTSLLDFSKSRH